MGSPSIEDLPDVVIEYIFCYLSPYRDLKSCRLVSKAWYAHVEAATRKIRREFLNAVSLQDVVWVQKAPESGPTISKRYSHSACVLGDSMFVFGGCTTANTTFNDLWRLDLATRRWIRPLSMGTYPPPKACASLVSYKDNLLLFGGWTHTSPYPLHQTWRIFRHLHIYNIAANRWTQVSTVGGCPSMAGHSATTQGSLMVVFGGLHCINPVGPFSSSNEVWVLDLQTYMWQKQNTTQPKPRPRYGHSQISLSDKHMLIIGGCGGPNTLLNDVWLLTIPDNPEMPWEWKQVVVTNREFAAPQLSFHPACKVGNRVVVLSTAQRTYAKPSSLHGMLGVRPPSRTWVPPRQDPEARARAAASHQQQKETCVNGTRGVLKRPLASSSGASPAGPSTSSAGCSKDRGQTGSSSDASEDESGDRSPQRTYKKTALGSGSAAETSQEGSAGEQEQPRPSIRPNARRDRQRQLEVLDRMAQRLRDLRAAGSQQQHQVSTGHHRRACLMHLYVLDVSRVTDSAEASWLPLQQRHRPSPSTVEEVILYSLVLGRGELILFGGIQRDSVNRPEDADTVQEVVSSSVYFVTCKHVTI
ncbi:F-box only protein 42-like [Ornithodoros turicata]|uniref:F-box domain-containing protein n=1 Tax=Ornithodoros turicata TaxID=34597 RepID=A0A2R5L9W7_9ACAR